MVKEPTHLLLIVFSANTPAEFAKRYAKDFRKDGLFIHCDQPEMVDLNLTVEFYLQPKILFIKGDVEVIQTTQSGITIRFLNLTPEQTTFFDKNHTQSLARKPQSLIGNKTSLKTTSRWRGCLLSLIFLILLCLGISVFYIAAPTSTINMIKSVQSTIEGILPYDIDVVPENSVKKQSQTTPTSVNNNSKNETNKPSPIKKTSPTTKTSPTKKTSPTSSVDAVRDQEGSSTVFIKTIPNKTRVKLFTKQGQIRENIAPVTFQRLKGDNVYKVTVSAQNYRTKSVTFIPSKTPRFTVILEPQQ